jgi:ferrous iron transport protein A
MKIMQKKRTIADLNSNEVAYIAENQNGNIPLKLIQMGCVSKTKVVLKMKAPSSDPVCIQIGGNDIALRIAEAKKIDITTR